MIKFGDTVVADVKNQGVKWGFAGIQVTINRGPIETNSEICPFGFTFTSVRDSQDGEKNRRRILKAFLYRHSLSMPFYSRK